MSNPKPEHRITAVEKRVTNLEGAIEELASDTDSNFRALRQEIQQGYVDIGKALDSHADGLMLEIRKVDTRLEGVEKSIKAEMAAMETRIIDTMKQLLQQKSGE